MNKKLKIGVLTQPLQDNYGGLLQAYALKETLTSLGHDVVIINRQYPVSSKIRTIASVLKSKILGRPVSPQILLTKEQKDIISRQTRSFREKYIPDLSDLITDNDGMRELNNLKFNAYVVGSDQCWRPRYSPYIRNYFLDFAKDQKNIKRISYAASFGVSEWEFTEDDTRSCKELLQKFNAISVREDSAVEMIKKFLGRNDAIHVVDPTMTLSVEHYRHIAKQEETTESRGTMKVYMLDRSEEKLHLVNQIGKATSLQMFEVLPKKRLGSEAVNNANVNDFAYPNPAQWLRGYQDARFVITDSFHGTVFSILFNIPFLAIGNKNRGLARFQSLLNMFNLSDRLITDLSNFDSDTFIQKEIDWSKVNGVLDQERKKATDFLRTNLQ